MERRATRTEADRELQIALDCFTLRHSAAEALVRLYLAATQHRAEGGSLWRRVSSTPITTEKLVTDARSALYRDQGSSFWQMVTPLEVQVLATQGAGLDKAQQKGLNDSVETSGEWLQRACALLVDEEMNLNVANNKIKHGIVVRAATTSS